MGREWNRSQWRSFVLPESRVIEGEDRGHLQQVDSQLGPVEPRLAEEGAQHEAAVLLHDGAPTGPVVLRHRPLGTVCIQVLQWSNNH